MGLVGVDNYICCTKVLFGRSNMTKYNLDLKKMFTPIRPLLIIIIIIIYNQSSSFELAFKTFEVNYVHSFVL